MTIEQYIAHIKDVIARLYEMYPDVEENKSLIRIFSIVRQLKFILHYAETGASFKAGVIEKAKAIYNNMFEWYPAGDSELKDAIHTIYSDLMMNDFNVGRLTQKESSYLHDMIVNKHMYYSDLMRRQKQSGVSKSDALWNNRELAKHFRDELHWCNYAKLWEDHGIKNLQYFFLKNVFGYVGITYRYFGDPDESAVGRLVSDIYKIRNFYTTLESEGTCMDINPVKIKEFNGKTHLVDLHGKIVA